MQPAVGQYGVDCPMSRAVRPKASKVPPGRNGWIRPGRAIRPVTCRRAGNKVQQPFQTTAHRQVLGHSGHWTYRTRTAGMLPEAAGRREIVLGISFLGLRTYPRDPYVHNATMSKCRDIAGADLDSVRIRAGTVCA